MLAAAWAWRAHAAPRNPAIGMGLERAYAEAERLVGARRHVESLPYFERMLELAPDEWSLRHDYSNALQGASLEGREVLGLRLRAARSSLEAIELMRRALAEMDRAQALARSPRDLATVHLARARHFGVWGFPCDAFSESRAAASADPSWNEAVAAVAEWTQRLREGSARAAIQTDHEGPRARRPAMVAASPVGRVRGGG
jgi:hypothetical protein